MLRPLLNVARGHYWTLRPFVAKTLFEVPLAPSTPFEAPIVDAGYSDVRVTGELRDVAASDTCLVAVHGLGGDRNSVYMRDAAAAAQARGISVLRLELRGANGNGCDLYNAGLSADLSAALASPELARYRRIVVMGFSLGGHLVLRWATEGMHDSRVGAVAAIGSPVDLEICAHDFDRKRVWPYRVHVLKALKAMAAPLAQAGRLPVDLRAAQAVTGMVQWDEQIVAPRFGYASAHAYYQERSVAEHLHKLRVPALYVGSEADPMVSTRSTRPALFAARQFIETRWLEHAGHVGFPSDCDLGLVGPRGLEAQALAWLLQH